MLTLLYVFNKADSIVLAPLVQPIKHELGIGDFQMGLLLGPAFAIFYGLCGLPMGWIVDHRPLRRVVYWGVTVWSIATAACGLVTGFVGLALARMMVGAGEATLSPSSYKLISQLFPRNKIALPLSMYAAGSSIGLGFALYLGGLAARLSSEGSGLALPGLGFLSAWKILFLALGLPGLLLALLAFRLPVPVGGEPTQAGDVASKARGSVFAFMLREWRVMLPIFGCFCAIGTGSIALLQWMPTYMLRTYHLDQGTIGLGLGAMLFAAGLTGHLISGMVVDAIHTRGLPNGGLIFGTVATVIGMPCGILALLGGSLWIYWPLMTVTYTLFIPFSGYAAAAVQLATPVEMRGRMSAVFLLLASATGQLIGPTAVGFFTQYVFRDEAMIGASMAAVCAVVLAVVLASTMPVLFGRRRATRAPAAAPSL
ncbi:MFS transporter [Sphingomonas immobilis]|uniref:MFS transporter n=1 Tax=Sphingomonas immobilis TaxID=3063997 RepID=A0ABT9A1C6_9SPHN|nr:MFS transporter [Sphingomonas sp. CA1-15]MDO7843631.1 MFS transporter [Sphingomonas sp. CA1-15]